MSNQWSFGQTFRLARQVSEEVKAAHQLAVREQRNGAFRPSCSCGWEAYEPSQLQAQALKQAIHHLAKTQRQFLDQLDNGVSLHEIVSGIREPVPAGEHAPSRTVKSNPA